MSIASMSSFHHNHTYADFKDFKKEILESVGDISGVEVFGQEVLVASYIMPNKTKAGLIIPGKTAIEDRWQSKAVLILKFGTEAHDSLKGSNSDERYAKRFNGRPLEEGDWVFANVQDTWHFDLKGDGSKMRKDNNGQKLREWEGWPVRLILIGDIKGRLLRPNEVV